MMECCFCRSEKASHLDPKLPLCVECAALRDTVREWAESKHIHGLNLADYGTYIMIHQHAPEILNTAPATVH